MDSWTFLTNHGHVLLSIAADPEIRLKEIATRVGITERSAQRIVAELVQEGYLTQAKVGRRNRYQVHPELHFRHPLEHDHPVGALIEVLRRTRSGVTVARPGTARGPHAQTAPRSQPRPSSPRA